MTQQINYQTSVQQQVPQTMTMSSHLPMQPQMQPQQMPNTVVSMQQQQVQQPARQERPARKGITIKDPNSGQDVTDKILKRKTTKEPAPEQTWTPPPQQQEQVPTPVAVVPEASAQDKIKAEFAAKVAARKDALEAGAKGIPEESKPKPAGGHVAANKSPVVPKENGQVQPNIVETASTPVVAAATTVAQVPIVADKSSENAPLQPTEETPKEPNVIADGLDKTIKPSEKDLGASSETVLVVESAQAASEATDSTQEIKTQVEPPTPKVIELPPSADVVATTNEEPTYKPAEETVKDSSPIVDTAVKTTGVDIEVKAEEIVSMENKPKDAPVVLDTAESNIQNTADQVDKPVEDVTDVTEKMHADDRPKEGIAEEPITVSNIAESETLPNLTEEETKNDSKVSIEKKEDAVQSSPKEIVSDSVNPIVNGFEKPTPASTVAQGMSF